VGPLRLNRIGPLAVAPRHQGIDEPPVVFDASEVKAAAQDQCLINRFLEMPVLGFHCPIFVCFTAIVAAGFHAIMTDERIIALCPHAGRRSSVWHRRWVRRSPTGTAKIAEPRWRDDPETAAVSAWLMSR